MKRSIVKYSAFLATITTIMLYAFNESDSIKIDYENRSIETLEDTIKKDSTVIKNENKQTNIYTKSGLLVD